MTWRDRMERAGGRGGAEPGRGSMMNAPEPSKFRNGMYAKAKMLLKASVGQG